MKVIICGAGQVGWQIARQLSGERNDVTIVDRSPTLVRRATDTLDVQGVVGHASYPDILQRAGARDAEMIIAATHSDEVNMVTCQVAHSIFNVRRKIARLRAQCYHAEIHSDLFRKDHVPIDVIISPEREVAEAALRRLNVPSAFDAGAFLGGSAQLLGIQLDEGCPVLDTPLRQLTDLFSTLRALVVAVRRNGRLFVPSAGDQLFSGDQVHVMTHFEDVARVFGIFGKKVQRQEHVVILGGGNVGLAVAQALEERAERRHVRVIERDLGHAEGAADALERTIVLHGDGMNSELLAEAGIERADAILAVTDDDNTNLLASVRAKQAGCPFAIALVNDPTLIPLMDPLSIDAYINPRATTVGSILRHVRHGGQVRSVYSIGDSEAEVIEAPILSTSSLSGRHVRDIAFPEGAIVGAVEKGGRMEKPTGSTRIDEGDVIVVFALARDVPEVERLFQVSIDFF